MGDNLNFYTLKQRIFIVKTFYKSDGDVNRVKKNFILEYGEFDDGLTDFLIYEAVNLFESTGNIRDVPQASKTPDEESSSDHFDDNFNENESIIPDIEEYTIHEILSKRVRMRRKKPVKEVTLDTLEETDYREIESLFACNKCGKRYLTREALMVHLTCHLSNEPKLRSCRYCPENFPTNFHLQCHIKDKHADILKKEEEEKMQPKPRVLLQCPQCPKTFTARTSYSRHLKTHSLKRDCICDTCGKGFRQSSYLKDHMKIHSDIRKFKCTFPNCESSFKHKQTLVLHERIHRDEKPFPCKNCGKCFRDRSTLKVHYRQHTNEHPYQCEICGKKTKQKQNLKSHMKHFHKINIPSRTKK